MANRNEVKTDRIENQTENQIEGSGESAVKEGVKIGWRTLIAFVVIAGVLLGGAWIYTTRGQQEASTQFGNEILSLCNNVNQSSPMGSTAADTKNRLIFVDMDFKTLDGTYNAQIPTDHLAHNKDDVTGLLCFKHYSKVINTQKVSNYTCSRYQEQVELYLVDVKSKKLADSKTFNTEGQCPATLTADFSAYPDTPITGKTLVDWALTH